MGVVPGGIDADAGPPTRLPLAHFLVGLLALAAGAAAGLAGALGWGGLTVAAHVHLLLAGWVCLTIMGAMTQFVPVWSGVALHSRRLAAAQLWLAAAGLAVVAGAFLSTTLWLVPAGGAVLLAGVWVFVYNVSRTLPRGLDATERHFAAALCFFLAVTVVGLALALDYGRPLLSGLGLARPDVLATHATLAVFGAVLTTVLGAVYQLATMFTQTELSATERSAQRAETVGYPVGVFALAAGRLADLPALARAGGLVVALGLATVAAIVAHKLVETRVEWTPMLSRYAVFAGATLLWAALAVPAWLARPTAAETVYGAPGGAHLLLLGVVGFVVWGTLYHVVPFIVWVGRYSDRLGLEPVPMIDDLYRDDLARADLGCLGAGVAALTADGLLALPDWTAPVGGLAVLAGVGLFGANLVLVVREHSPHSVPELLAGAAGATSDVTGPSDPGD